MAMLQGYVVAWCMVICCGVVPAASQAPSSRPQGSPDLRVRARGSLYDQALPLLPRPEGDRRLHAAPVDVPAERPAQRYIDDELRRQAEGARYSFSTSVTDGISDNTHVRQESRDGLRLAGLYSYSDGFFKHTVHYEADERGYRVLKDDVEPIGDGPRVDPLERQLQRGRRPQQLHHQRR